jgi:hypothetical protein
MDSKKLEEKIKEDIAFYLLDADWPFPKNIQDEFARIITRNFEQARNETKKDSQRHQSDAGSLFF